MQIRDWKAAMNRFSIAVSYARRALMTTGSYTQILTPLHFADFALTINT